MTLEDAVKRLIVEAEKQEKESVVAELENLLRYCQRIVLPDLRMANVDMSTLFKVSVGWNDLLEIADRLRFSRQQLIPYNR